MSRSERRLLEIEATRIRYEWAQAEAVRKGGSTGLTEYLKVTLAELLSLVSIPSEKQPRWHPPPATANTTLRHRPAGIFTEHVA